ncbi:MAG: protein phosphatase 2C domain-containing protein [Gracilibacteraceae bacterium]|jgi:serine/threonine protein phosphatase PrpC|nr:protein phosphatase 2C domain-containing protein [Gracilibacteraceae bacterium]
MRKDIVEFLTSYVSFSGTQLFNNDHYGFAEQENYACYVLADGLEGGNAPSPAAEVAVKAAMAAFHERPSLATGVLRAYAQAAHDALAENPRQKNWRASIMIVVTDYEYVRYVHLGDVRFTLYRKNKEIEQSLDHSLGRENSAQDTLSTDRLARHEYRHNLSRYLGQMDSIEPQVSKKIKLKDGDMFTLCSRGIWENCHPADMRMLLDTSVTPEETVDPLERLLADNHPAFLDNYTFAAVFANKVYDDPKRPKRRKWILIGVLAAVILIGVITLLLVLRHNKLADLREKLDVSYISCIEYIEDGNFARAGEEIEKASELADELKDGDKSRYLSDLQKLTESVLRAEAEWEKQNYAEAANLYEIARTRVRHTDNLGSAYIERRLGDCWSYINIDDLLLLGYTLADNGLYETARENYQEARRLSAALRYTKGKDEAQSALEELAEKMNTSAAASADSAALLTEAAGLETSGDKLVEGGKLSDAILLFQLARGRFAEAGDDDSVQRLDDKLGAADMAAQESALAVRDAVSFITSGDALLAAGDMNGAKILYVMARNIYARIGDEDAMRAAENKIYGVELQTETQPVTPPAESGGNTGDSPGADDALPEGSG